MTDQTLSGYELSRKWFDFCFENPELIIPNHTALYFFIIEHCNRMGWKQKFGLPSQMAKDAIGIKSYNTYINTLKDLVEWGFVKMVQKSKNQYSANIVALLNFDKALDKALDKAMLKHMTKQRQSTVQSISTIDKHITLEPLNHKPLNKEQDDFFLAEKISLKNEEEIKMPFTSENFRVLWLNWKKYRLQEFKRKYKSIQSEQSALSHLAKISGGIETNAFEIISISMSNQWQGLFELKPTSNGTGKNEHQHRSGAEVSTASAFSKIDSMPDKA